MHSSRISRDTAKIVETLSTTRRQTRSSTKVTSSVLAKSTPSKPSIRLAETAKADGFDDGSDTSSLSSANTTDIEDILSPRPSKRRKRESPSSPGANVATSPTSTLKRTPRKVVVKKEETPEPKAKPKPKAQRKLPARKTTAADGTVTIEPPSNWETMYKMVESMRIRNPTAPVDTMGCAQLYWRSSSPRDQRFHTLIALMLSSQTKDTVTAVAMQKLHTQLTDTSDGSENENKASIIWDHSKQTEPSTLTLENILAVSPTKLNQLIGSVGFHNNKTKYIKAAALILRDEYNSDIPDTPEGLMRLPGVGPKMAYLCMSAAWGRHEGIGVDVHVHRITNMWGWNNTKTPEQTRMALESWLPKDKWHDINKLLVGLGQTVCLPVGRRCGECDLAGMGLCKGEVKGGGAASKRRAVKKEEADVPTKGESKVEIKMEEIEPEFK